MQHHELIENKALAAGNRACLWPAHGQASAAQIENGDLVAEAVHLDDGPISERAQDGKPGILLASPRYRKRYRKTLPGREFYRHFLLFYARITVVSPQDRQEGSF